MENTLKNTTVIHSSISCVASNREISLSSLGLPLDELPSQMLTYWKESVIPKEVLRPFSRARKEFDDLMGKHAERTLIGDVIAPDDIKMLVKEIEKIQTHYLHEKAKLKANWNTICSDVIQSAKNKFKNYSHLDDLVKAVKKAQPEWVYLNNQIDFVYHIYEFGTPTTGDDAIDKQLVGSVKSMNEGLYSKIIGSVAKKSSDLIGKLSSKTVVNRRTITVVEEYILKRVQSLSYLDSRLLKVTKAVEEALIPLRNIKGTIHLNDIGELVTLLSLMSSEQRLLQRIEEDKPLLVKQKEVATKEETQSKSETEIVEDNVPPITQPKPKARPNMMSFV